MNRFLETLFRNPLLFLTPVLVVPAIALISVLIASNESEQSALIWVEPSPFLDSVTTSRDTANVVEAQALRERMETENFRLLLMERVGLREAIDNGDWPPPTKLGEVVEGVPGLLSIGSVRSFFNSLNITNPESTDQALARGLRMVNDTITVEAEGNNLLRVTYTGPEPELGKRMVEQTIALYNEKALERRNELASLGVAFYADQVNRNRERLDRATLELQAFVAEFPEPLPGQQRPLSEQSTLDQLVQSQQREQTLYENSLRKLNEIELDAEEAISARNQRFAVLDSPKEPEPTRFNTKNVAVAGLLGISLGVLLGSAFILVIIWRDDSVNTSADVAALLNPELVTDVPDVKSDGDGVRNSLVRMMSPTGQPA